MVHLGRIILLEVEGWGESGGADDSGDARHGGGDGVGVEDVHLNDFGAGSGETEALSLLDVSRAGADGDAAGAKLLHDAATGCAGGAHDEHGAVGWAGEGGGLGEARGGGVLQGERDREMAGMA